MRLFGGGFGHRLAGTRAPARRRICIRRLIGTGFGDGCRSAFRSFGRGLALQAKATAAGRSRFPRYGRRQRLQQRFAIIGLIAGFGRRLCPRGFIAAITPITLPVTPAAPFAATIIPRGFLARAIITCTFVTLAIVTLALFPGAVVALALVAGPFVPRTLVAITLLTRRLVPFASVGGITVGIVAVGQFVLEPVAAALAIAAAVTAAFGLPFTIVAQHAEIMFGILQIIFCGHPIAGLLRVARQGAILLQQLGGVAALAIVQTAAIVVAAGHLLRARTAAAATTPTPLVVPDQDRRSRIWPYRAAVGQNTPPLAAGLVAQRSRLCHPGPALTPYCPAG